MYVALRRRTADRGRRAAGGGAEGPALRPCPAASGILRLHCTALHGAREPCCTPGSESDPYGNGAYISDVHRAAGTSVHPACNMKVRATPGDRGQ